MDVKLTRRERLDENGDLRYHGCCFRLVSFYDWTEHGREFVRTAALYHVPLDTKVYVTDTVNTRGS